MLKYEPLHDRTKKMTCSHEETLGPKLPFEHTVKTLIRLGGCPGWSESSLGAHVILLVLSCGGSITCSVPFIFCVYFQSNTRLNGR